MKSLYLYKISALIIAVITGCCSLSASTSPKMSHEDSLNVEARHLLEINRKECLIRLDIRNCPIYGYATTLTPFVFIPQPYEKGENWDGTYYPLCLEVLDENPLRFKVACSFGFFDENGKIIGWIDKTNCMVRILDRPRSYMTDKVGYGNFKLYKEPDLKSDFQILKMSSSGDEAVPLTFKNGFCNVIINTDDGIRKGWLPYFCTSYYSCGN